MQSTSKTQSYCLPQTFIVSLMYYHSCRYLSTNDNIHGNDFNKSAAEDGLRNKEGDTNISLLEAELKEMRERYFHMSLRYAEVEAQREELVMKVKSMKIGKRWFSIS